MSKKADEIRSEIEQTRGAMGNTLEALGDRVAPKKMAARAKADVADKVEDVRHRLSPAGAVRRTTSKLRESLQGAKPISNGNTSREIGVAGGEVTGSRTATSDVPGKLVEKARSASDTLTEKAGAAPETLTEKAAGNPLAVGLLAFGAGMVVAGLLPPTERERQVAGLVKERVEPLKDQALEAGRTIMGELKPAAQGSLEQVKERAAGAVEQVKGEARGAAEELKQGAQTASGQVKQTTRAASGRARSEAKRSTAAVKGEAKQSATAAKQAVKRTASSGRSTKTPSASRPRTTRNTKPASTTSPAAGARTPRRAASTPRSTSRAR